MNNKITISILAISIALFGLFFVSNNNGADKTVLHKDAEQNSQALLSGKVPRAPSVDITKCTKQLNDAYICPVDAISDFGPVFVTDTASGNTCRISYQEVSGFSFTGKSKSGLITSGQLAVALYPSGNVATIARSEAKTISLHAREDGTLDHIIFVDSNYASEQCLSGQ